MNMQTPFTLASVNSPGVWRSLGLRLRGLYQFQDFWPLALVQKALAALVFAVCGPCGQALFSRFRPNPALKPTRILRVAYIFR